MPYFRDHAVNWNRLNVLSIFDHHRRVNSLPTSLLLTVTCAGPLSGGTAYRREAYADAAIWIWPGRQLHAESVLLTFPPEDHSTIHFLMAASRRLKAALPLRARCRSFFGSYGHCQPISQSPLGPLGNVRYGDSDQLFSCDLKRSLPVGRISWSGTGLHSYTLRGADAAVNFLLNFFKSR